MRENPWYLRGVLLLAGVWAVWLLAFVAVGCGSGSETLSKEEYGKQLNQICADFNAKEKEIGEPNTVPELVAKLPEVLDTQASAIAKVKELKAPAEIEDQAARFVALSGQMRDLVSQLIEAAKANDMARIQELAAKIGPLETQGDAIAKNELGAPACAGEPLEGGDETSTSSSGSADEQVAAGGVAKLYGDPTGDVKGGKGPDVVGVTLSNTSTNVTFRFVFAQEPPLAMSEARIVSEWNDMLLVGIDTPPYGAKPIPQGEWRGGDYWLGTHGSAKTGTVVQAVPGNPQKWRRLADLEIATAGKAITFSIPRRTLGNPASFRFMAAAGREGSKGSEDFAPNTGTFRYVLTG